MSANNLHHKVHVVNEIIAIQAGRNYDAKIPERGLGWTKMTGELGDIWLDGRAFHELGEFTRKPSVSEAADVLNFLTFKLINRGVL